MGITTNHIDSRHTSKIKLKEKIGDRSNLATYEELVLDIDFLINNYQHEVFDNVESAQMRFKRLFNEDKVLPLLKSDKVAITSTFRSAKVENSEIKIECEGSTYYYQIPGIQGENIKEINISYDTSDLKEIHLFNENLEYLMSLSVMEKIPFMISQRTSSQQQKYFEEYAARENRFKQLIKDIERKEEVVNAAFSNSLSYEVLRIHDNKQDEIETQNEFTRRLINEESTSGQEEPLVEFPTNSVETQVPKEFKLKLLKK